MTTRPTPLSAAEAMRAMAPRDLPTPPAAPRTDRPAEKPRASRHFDRAAWERAVMSSTLHPAGRALAFVLAHHAGSSGHFVPDRGLQLGEQAGLTARQVTISFDALTNEGFIIRPPRRGWDSRQGTRPITLRMPVPRDEPPSTGERP